MRELTNEERKKLKELKEKARKKVILQWLTIITGIVLIILLIYGGIRSKKVVKADISDKYQIVSPQIVSEEIKNNSIGANITQSPNDPILTTYDEEYESTYNIYQIRAYIDNNTNQFRINLSYVIVKDNSATSYVMWYEYRAGANNYEFSQIANSGTSQQNTIPNTEKMLTLEWEFTQTGYNNVTTSQYYTNGLDQFITRMLPRLQTPTITLNQNTIHWQQIENADYYNIFMNGNLIGQTEFNQWVTIENGVYTIQACTNDTENYSNSEISNSITQSNYNDMIGNGVNWFTFFSAYVDSQVALMKAYLNYTIWDINFFQLFTFIITIILAVYIIKFIKGW